MPAPPSIHRTLVLALGAALSVAGLAALDSATKTPFLFPSLGATTFLLIAAPEREMSSTRNAFFGHLIGAASGWLALWLCGVDGTRVALGSFDVAHILSASLALGLTTFALLRLRISHPPAGATTLIFGIGLLPHAWQVPMVGGSALLLALEARLFHRLAGLSLPWWSAAPERPDSGG